MQNETKNIKKDGVIGKVMGVAIGKKRGESKVQVPYIELIEGIGVAGDAHAGSDKEVSLVAIEDIIEMNNSYNIDANIGDFAENIATHGINLMHFSPGDEIQIGSTILRVICLGKSAEEMKNHVFSFKGYKLLPYKGLFCMIIKGGHVRRHDLISVLNQKS